MTNLIEIYSNPDDQIELKVQFDKDAVWLNQYQLAELFIIDMTSILKHLKVYMRLQNLMKKQLVQKLHKSVKKVKERLQLVDSWVLYDNSGEIPQLIDEGENI